MKTILACFVLLASIWGATAQTTNYQLSSHILDISTGKPVPGVYVQLAKWDDASPGWKLVDSKLTDKNGRITNFLPTALTNLGTYKLTFQTADYFKKQQISSFYPYIDVVFQLSDTSHYHVPITLSPFGYSTYRGN